jgi:hypothetical protein
MRAIYVPLPERVASKLRGLARREYRDTHVQATVLIVDGLRRAGLDPAQPTDAPGADQTRRGP